MQHNIKLYNTLSRTVEDFTPITPGKVSIYSCGPTVYHYAQIGNLRSYVFADIIHRIFEYTGYDVKHIINVTDIGHLVTDGDDGEDKMTKALKREGKPLTLEAMREVANFYFEKFKEDCDALNIRSATHYPFASDHIQEDIGLVTALLEKGYGYSTSDGIYFDTSKFTHYPDLAKLDIEGLKSGARVETNAEKRNSTDFALWKFNGDLGYEAPFGKGFPGWHIECSAMSMKYLGNHFDIHTGGIDHIPVHHTNEIAQSEAATGEKYVNYWMHNNFLNDASGKMSKSKGEFLRLQSVIDEGISPLAYRYYLLTTHYRKEIEFSFEALKAAAIAYEKFVVFAEENSGTKGEIHEHYKKLFDEALFDDLGTPQGIAVIWNMMKDTEVSNEDKYATLMKADEVLGLNLKHAHKKIIEIPDEVRKLLDERKVARANKNFAQSDELRDMIYALGFEVKDSSEGQSVNKI